MGIEIERKFLLCNPSWRARVHAVQYMTQGYLSPAPALDQGPVAGASVRVRIADQAAYLNLKSHARGIQRQEFDYPIPLDDAQALLALCDGRRLEKRRHLVQHGRWLWEIDEFLGDNAGLAVAEIELKAVDEVFERPDWLGPEVTDQTRYYNVMLAQRPYALWREEEKNSCL